MPADDEEISGLVVDLLEAGPMSGFGIARALEEKFDALQRGRQGGLYPVLLQLERSGCVESHWEKRDGEQRRMYVLPVLVDCGPVPLDPSAKRAEAEE